MSDTSKEEITLKREGGKCQCISEGKRVGDCTGNQGS